MMNILEVFSRADNQRFILVLQEEMASWFRVVAGEVVDSYVECVSDEPDQHGFRPAWITGSATATPLRVELVLDTTLDEVDRVRVNKTGHRLVDRYRQLAILLRLRNDYPRASVYSLPTRYQEQVAAVMHPTHPACWVAWLLTLQSNNVVFHQVCTGTELAARWSRRINTPVFMVMHAGHYQRHLMVDGGATVFLRTMKVTGSGSGEKNPDNTRVAVEQSMAYLGSAIELTDESFPVLDLHGSSGKADHDTMTGEVGNSQAPDMKTKSPWTVVAASVDTLVSMLLDKPVSYDCCFWQGGHISDATAEKDEAVLTESWLSKRFPGADRLIRDRYCLIEWQGRIHHGWRLSNSALRWIEALAPSVQYQKVSGRVAAMFKAALALAFVATVALGVSVAHGTSSARTLRSQLVRLDNTNASITDIQAKLENSYTAPWHFANALYLLDQLSSMPSVATSSLLDDIATAITRVPAVSLDHMVWAVLESDETFDSLAYALASVGHRQSLGTQRTPAIVQLELAGRITGETLYSRKRQLDEFVVQLRLLPGVLDIRIMESPADAAMSSTMQGRSQESFRLSLRKVQGE